LIHEVLGLFAATEVFIYVFMELATHIQSVCRVATQQALWYDKVIFVLIFGGFSIFGTYTGIVLPSGAISSIRDLGPLIAGLIGGPWAGLGAGLIGGAHRYFYGGWTNVPCALATVLAGVIGGIVYNINKKKLLNIFYSVLLAVIVEFIHGMLALVMVQPFDKILDTLLIAIPAMMIANGIGAAISIITMERIAVEPKQVNDA